MQIPDHYPILIVDDHPVNRKVIGYLLSNLGLEFEAACDGAQAVDMASKNTYGAILMDVMMPLMDGWQATRLIREHEFASGQHTPIIAVTAMDLALARERCLEAGMDDFLLKPVSKEILRERLERWLQKPVARILGDFRTHFEHANLSSNPINRERLKLLYGTDDIGDVLEIFVTATDALLIELQKDIASKNAERATRVALELKGSAFTISAEEMAALAVQLEKATRAEEWEEALKLYVLVAKAFASVQDHLTQVVRMRLSD